MNIIIMIALIIGFIVGFISSEVTHIFDLEENEENETDRKS